MYGRVDRLVALGMLMAAPAVLAVAAWLQPAACGYGTHTQLGLPPCNFLRLTHLPCPSCGLTTSFAWAIRMQFGKAFMANPFGILLFFATIASIPFSLVLLLRRISFRRFTEHRHFIQVLYFATALYLISWGFKLSQFHFAGR